MKLTGYLFATLVILLSLTACKNDVELNAPYKEIPSIYAVLNPFDEVNTIRINKVFLGEGDANVMAKVSDSVNYQPGEITVTLKSKKSAIITFSETLVETEPGAFTTSQRVYTTKEQIPAVDMTGTVSSIPVYTLTVKNNRTGNIFTATASPVQKVFVSNIDGDLRLPHYPNYPAPDKVVEKDFTDYNSRRGAVYFPPNKNDKAAIYKLVISTVYSNYYAGWKALDSVDYVFGNRYPKDATRLGGTDYITTSFNPADYFSAVGVALGKKNVDKSVYRKLERIHYHIYASTQEYLDYLEYAKPSLSFNQTKPLYSNFVDQAAIGIFTFRSHVVVMKLPTSSFVNAFSYNPNTCQYRFYDANGVWQGCQ